MELTNSGQATASVDLEAGGRLSSLMVDGVELLVTSDASTFGWGSFPMAPWAGRVRDGRFAFGSEKFQLPLALPPHAIHGTAVHQQWKQVDENTIRADLGPAWPFGGFAEQRFSLSSDRLRLELSVGSTSMTMPAMVGWHPWFRRSIGDDEAELTFVAESMYELDEVAIPTGRLVAPPPPPWDNAFTNVTDGPTLRWGERLSLRFTSSCDDWIIYTPDHAICIEPQSEAPDAFNRTPKVLEPGDTLTEWFEIQWGEP